ncbi:uncharacterized protein METZ01_LOCUS158151 [marine metagenome]|uniref:histidinol-phosphate transaminase n=1 Tax=marine metagenome TaxID=408172 RepID=A0A382AWG4_9ZZZZ
MNISTDNIEIGSGTIDILERLLSLFKYKTVTSIGPYWTGIKWSCFKNDLKFDEHDGDIAYISYPNSRDGLLREINFDDYEFVIIDEAYGDYCNESYLKQELKNVIVTKTFSKSLSMPGIRFAYCVGELDVINKLKKISHKYSINSAVQSILPDAFDLIHPHVTRMLETKKVLEKEYDCLPSYANFVKPLIKPNYNVDVQKIENFYRFTLVDKDTLDGLLIRT